MIYTQSAQQARDGPVESTVLENVESGHCVGGELVHKQSLNLTLDKVRNDHAKRPYLRLRALPGWGVVEERTGGEDGAVDEDGAEIFDEKDGPPGDLHA